MTDLLRSSLRFAGADASRRWRGCVGAAALVLLVAAAPVAAQVPVEVVATAPASGWATPGVGETVTVRVHVGTAAAPASVRFVGFKLFYRPEAFELVSQASGPLVAAVDFDDSDGSSDGLRLMRHDAGIYGTARNALSFSVSLFNGKPLISADGRAAFEVVLRVKAVVAHAHYALVPGEVELRDGDGALVPSRSGVVRSHTVAGGSGVDPDPVTFPEAGGARLDFASLGTGATVTVRHSEDAQGGTALPGSFVTITSGAWSFSLDAATSFAAEVCFPFTHVTVGVLDRGQIRIHKRADGVSSWVELPTRLVPNATSPDHVCADVTGFSEFTITAPLSALPVELAAFSAVQDGDAIVLRWTTASETNNARFGVEQQSGTGWREVGFVAGHGTTAEAHAYTYRVSPMTPGRHRFRLRQVDFDGTARYSPEVEASVSSGADVWLGAPVPNPASATAATARFALATPADVRLAVYDLTGRAVAWLASGPMPAGPHERRFETAGLPAGVYLLRLEAGLLVRTTRLILLR